MELNSQSSQAPSSLEPKPLLNKKTKLQVYAKIRSIENLSPIEIERMFQLMTTYYSNTNIQLFKNDLMEKNDVILLFDKKTHSIQGFSTLLKVKINVAGKQVIGVYSGDTVLAKEYWGSSALGVSFLKYLWNVKLKNIATPVYWFLISKGYKTYLLMANNFKTHYPRFELQTPPHFKMAMKQFYGERFKEHYLDSLDLIKFNGPSCHLKDHVAPIQSEHLSLPRVQFFQNRNPGWEHGDELACIAEMNFLLPFVYFIKKRFLRKNRK